MLVVIVSGLAMSLWIYANEYLLVEETIEDHITSHAVDAV